MREKKITFSWLFVARRNRTNLLRKKHNNEGRFWFTNRDQKLKSNSLPLSLYPPCSTNVCLALARSHGKKRASCTQASESGGKQRRGLYIS